MKKFILVTVFLFTTSMLFAQFYEITPTAGYTFSGKVDNGYGKYDVSNSFLIGGKLDVQFTDLSYFELSYRRNDPTVTYSNVLDKSPTDFDAGIEHYMLGYLQELATGKIKPYGVISAGTSRYWGKSKSTDYRKWFFSTEFGVGAKIFLSENIGIRAQASVTTPWDFAGGGMWWGVGTGGSNGSASLTFGVPIAHWDLSAGLIIRIKD